MSQRLLFKNKGECAGLGSPTSVTLEVRGGGPREGGAPNPGRNFIATGRLGQQDRGGTAWPPRWKGRLHHIATRRLGQQDRGGTAWPPWWEGIGRIGMSPDMGSLNKHIIARVLG